MDKAMFYMENPTISWHARHMRRQIKGLGFPGQRIVVLPPSIIARAPEHPLLRGLLPTDIGYFPHAKGHLIRRPLGVYQTIFIHCTAGAGWCEVDGRRHDVRVGELLVLPALTPHAYGSNSKRPWTIQWFHAVGEEVGPLLGELGITLERPIVYLGNDLQLAAVFEEALGVLERGYALPHLIYASQILTHLIGRMIWRQRETWQGEPDPHQRIAQSVAYMKQHMDQPLTISKLAELAGFSPSHYAALFKDQTGYSPLDYFIRLRMHYACQLLDTTTMGIKQVASKLGYEDPFYFSRAFRSVNEVAPSDYRQRVKG